jgi:hypothetical protein
MVRHDNGTVRLCCPWCGQETTAFPTRHHDDGIEHECSLCGERFTLKDGEDEHAYPFCPADIAAAFTGALPEIPLE